MIKVKQYQVGEELITTGDKIAQIVGQTQSCGVFITENKQIRWEWYSDDPIPVQAVATFERLALTVANTLKEGRRDNYRVDIATSLRAALCADSEDAQKHAFDQVRSRIIGLREKMCKVRFMVSGISVLVLELLILAFLTSFSDNALMPFLNCALWGTIGAAMSGITKVKNLTVEFDAPIWFSTIEGVIRVIFGAMCGVAAYLLVKSNLAFGTFAENMYAVYLIALASGFVERLVPDVLATVVKRAS